MPLTMNTKNVMMSALLFLVISLVSLVTPATATVYNYCAWDDPGFNSAPTVTQVNLQKVRVSWNGTVTKIECVANFHVKYWKQGYPNDWENSKSLNANEFSTEIEVNAGVKYIFHVVAIE